MTYYIDAEGKLQELGALQVSVTEEKSLQEAWTEILNDPLPQDGCGDYAVCGCHGSGSDDSPGGDVGDCHG